MSISTRLNAALHHRLVLPFYLPSFLVSVAFGMLITLLPLYARSELGTSYTAVGVIVAGFRIGKVLTDLPTGRLLRRLGQKRLMLIGTAAMGIGTGVLYWTETPLEAVLGLVIAGFGMSAFHIARHAYVIKGVRSGKRGRAIAILGGVVRGGQMAGPALGGWVAGVSGLRLPFLLMAGCFALSFLSVVVFFPRTPSQPEVFSQENSVSFWFIVMQYRGVLAAAGVGQALAQILRAGREIVIPLYAADVLGLNVELIGLIGSFFGLIDATLFYPAGWLMDQMGRKWAIIPSFLIQTAGVGLIPLSQGLIGLLIAVGIAAVGNGISAGTMMTLGGDLSPKEGQGEFLGVWQLIGDAGSGLGPLLVGAIAQTMALVSATLAIAGFGLGAVLIFAWMVPETLKEEPELPERERTDQDGRTTSPSESGLQ